MSQKIFAPDVSEMSATLIASEVLRIAGEIAALKQSGHKILNFTVGDFDPQQFPIPEALKSFIVAAVSRGETNYPPSSGIMELRRAVANFYVREFDVPTSPEEILIAGGARPLIYAIFTTLLEPGDKVLYPVPSWNNNHYAHLARAKGVAIECRPENGFLPRASEIAAHIHGARLLCLNSPLNPAGTAFSREQLTEILDLVLAENIRRRERGERALYLLFDQIYWKLTLAGAAHEHPLRIRPELRPWTLFVDGVSKYFCGTGLRVGWSALPKELVGVFSGVLGHIGAWAPKAEQIAVAEFLNDSAAISKFIRSTSEKISRRLFPLYEIFQNLKQNGLPVDAIRPQGGIYLSARFALKGSDEEIRKRLLFDAGIAVVPFQAFGLTRDSGWFRLSVGAVSESEVAELSGKCEPLLKA